MKAKYDVSGMTCAATIIEPAGVPTRKSNTSKAVILIAFTFLGAFAASGIVVVKDLFFKKENPDEGTGIGDNPSLS